MCVHLNEFNMACLVFFFPLAGFTNVCGAADGPLCAPAHIVASRSFKKEIRLLVITNSPLAFFHAISWQCWERWQAY